MRKRIGIDLDNTLCIGDHWDTEEQALKAKPILPMIELCEELYKDHFIIIYTARQNFLMSATFEWLDKHNVKYHAVANGKAPLDFLIDDTAINPWERKHGSKHTNPGKKRRVLGENHRRHIKTR